MLWIRFGYVLDTGPMSRDDFGYASNCSKFGYAGSEVREGCTKNSFGYVLDTRTPLQHIHFFWIRILGAAGRQAGGHAGGRAGRATPGP